jgi:hypothetical protein
MTAVPAADDIAGLRENNLGSHRKASLRNASSQRRACIEMAGMHGHDGGYGPALLFRRHSRLE